MKEHNNEKSFKAVEPKSSFFKSEPRAEKRPSALVAKKGLKYSSTTCSWSVNAGDDVSGLSADKLEILKNNGAI